MFSAIQQPYTAILCGKWASYCSKEMKEGYILYNEKTSTFLPIYLIDKTYAIAVKKNRPNNLKHLYTKNLQTKHLTRYLPPYINGTEMNVHFTGKHGFFVALSTPLSEDPTNSILYMPQQDPDNLKLLQRARAARALQTGKFHHLDAINFDDFEPEFATYIEENKKLFEKGNEQIS
jgi:hypothetical protein